MRRPFTPGDTGNLRPIGVEQANFSATVVHGKISVDVGCVHPTVNQAIAIASQDKIRARRHPDIVADGMSITSLCGQRPSTQIYGFCTWIVEFYPLAIRRGGSLWRSHEFTDKELLLKGNSRWRRCIGWGGRRRDRQRRRRRSRQFGFQRRH
jgi:hypothetical protein